MRFTTSKGLLASLAVAGAMVGGALLSPASPPQPGKGDAKPIAITISGTALNPDGSPGAKLPVVVKSVEKTLRGAGGSGEGDPGAPPPDLLSQGSSGAAGKGGAKGGSKGGKSGEGVYKTIGRGMTDESGRFAVKATTHGQGDQTVMVEIGDVTKTPFIRKTMPTMGKDVDMGNVTLNPIATPDR